MRADELVLVTEPLAQAPARWLSSHVETREVALDDPGLLDQLRDAGGLVVRTYTRVDERLLDAAPRLKVIGRAGVGYDNVDVAAARRRDVEVVYTPGANTQAVVEFVLRTLLSNLRPAPEVTCSMGRERWRQVRRESVGRRQLGDLTVGVLGLGRIGGRLARALSSLGGEVLYNDLLEIPVAHRHDARPVPLEVLFESADVLSIHVDGRPTNRRFASEPLLSRLRSDAILINTSRGFVVDNDALVGFLRANPNAVALLDVHEPEPVAEGAPLLGLPNARLTPHLAGATAAAHDQMGWVVRDVVAVLEGRDPEHPVPPQPPGP